MDYVGYNIFRTFPQILLRCRAMGVKEEIEVNQASHRPSLLVMKSLFGCDTAESCFWGDVRWVPMYLGLTNTCTIGRGIPAIYRPTGHGRSPLSTTYICGRTSGPSTVSRESSICGGTSISGLLIRGLTYVWRPGLKGGCSWTDV